MKKQFDKKVKLFILNSLDFSGYDIDPQTTEEKIRTLEQVFMAEYGWQVPRLGRAVAIREWLLGLPSVISIPFTYYDIEQLLRSFGAIDATKTPRQVEKLVDNYWQYVAVKIDQLFNGYAIPKDATL